MQDNYSLTSLDLRANQISEAVLQETQLLIQRNIQAMIIRRQKFLYKMILLARDANNPQSTSLWRHLPNDVKFYGILKHLNFQGKAHIGKTSAQVQVCARFIFIKWDECQSLIESKQKIRLIEKKDSIGHYHFEFFKPLKESPTTVLEQSSPVKHKLL